MSLHICPKYEYVFTGLVSKPPAGQCPSSFHCSNLRLHGDSSVCIHHLSKEVREEVKPDRYCAGSFVAHLNDPDPALVEWINSVPNQCPVAGDCMHFRCEKSSNLCVHYKLCEEVTMSNRKCSGGGEYVKRVYPLFESSRREVASVPDQCKYAVDCQNFAKTHSSSRCRWYQESPDVNSVVPATPAKAECKDTTGKPQLGLIIYDCSRAIEAMARVREFGNKKYLDRDNWKQVATEDFIEANGRHLAKRARGQDLDEESNLKHLAHAATSLVLALEQELIKLEQTK